MLGSIVMRGLPLLFAALVACVSVLVGCGKETPEDAVISQYQRGEDAIAIRDVTTFRNTMTSESWDSMGEHLKLAREATEAQMKALPAATCARIVSLRNRCTAASLKSMTIEDYAVWQIDNGFLVVDADYGVYPHKVSIRGDVAEMQMGEEIESRSSNFRVRRRGGAVRAIGAVVGAATAKRETAPIPGMVYQFKNLGGYWYHDMTGSTAAEDDMNVSEAKLSGGSVHDYILAVEQDAHGSLIENVWNPPK
jgi:hypothetical protein